MHAASMPVPPSRYHRLSNRENNYVAVPNENWVNCEKCGSPVMRDPQTGELEPCSTCLDKASPSGLYLRTLVIAAGLIVIGLLIFYCIKLLNA